MATVTSSFGTLNWKDFAKGAIIAVLSTVIPVIKATVDAGQLTFNWDAIATVSISAFLAYILKNWLTPSEVKVTGLSQNLLKSVKKGDSIVKIVDKKSA